MTGLNSKGGGVAAAGQMLIRFETAGPIDLQNYAYLIVFNTSGNGIQPYASSFNSNYLNWSAYFIVGGGSGYANSPGLEQIYENPTGGNPQPYNIVYPAGTVSPLSTIPTANSANGFQFSFNRCLLDLQPPSGSQPAPVSTNRSCPPYLSPGVTPTWNISIFTLDRTPSPVDSLSVNGPNSTSQPIVQIDTSTVVNDFQYVKPASNTTVQSAAAQITGIDISTTP